MMKLFQIFLLIQVCSGLRISRWQEDDQAFGFKKGAAAPLSFLKVAIPTSGANESSEVLDFAFGKAVGEYEGFRPLPGGLLYSTKCTKGCGVRYDDVTEFMQNLFTDLPKDKLEGLEQCHVKVRGNKEESGVAGEVWVLLNAEKLTREEIKRNEAWNDPKKKILILGAPGADHVGEHARNIYLPYASMEFVDTEKKYNPLHLEDRSDAIRKLSSKDDQHIYAYQHQNCGKAGRRVEMFDKMCKYLVDDGLSCHALGKCSSKYAKIDNENNAGGRAAVGPDGRILRTVRSIERYERYKFVESMENNAGTSKGDGYITEKILSAFLAGSVPVYLGGEGLDFGEVFNPEAVLIVDPNNPKATTDRMKYLAGNSTAYKEMISLPAVLPEQMRKYFTWHPATWPKHGTFLRDKIVDEILSLCHSK